jgi:hypothetical protein
MIFNEKEKEEEHHPSVSHCDEMVFFSWVPFIQMHMVINISLNLLIRTWI